MAEFTVRSDSVNVEQIMEQIRARIREKRGVDYTEAQIRELAAARLEHFIDPDKLHSNLLREFHRIRAEGDAPAALDVAIDESVLFETHRPWLRSLRKLLGQSSSCFSIRRRLPRCRLARRRSLCGNRTTSSPSNSFTTWSSS